MPRDERGSNKTSWDSDKMTPDGTAAVLEDARPHERPAPRARSDFWNRPAPRNVRTSSLKDKARLFVRAGRSGSDERQPDGVQFEREIDVAGGDVRRRAGVPGLPEQGRGDEPVVRHIKVEPVGQPPHRQLDEEAHPLT
jgi:hypothetical protein